MLGCTEMHTSHIQIASVLCRQTGVCYSIYHTASIDGGVQQSMVAGALADAQRGASCTALSSRFAAGLKLPPASDDGAAPLADALQQAGALQQVS